MRFMSFFVQTPSNHPPTTPLPPTKVGIDPMRLPEGLDDDVALLEELGLMQDDIEAHKAPAAGHDDDDDDGPLLSARHGVGPLLGGGAPAGRGWSQGRKGGGGGGGMAAAPTAAGEETKTSSSGGAGKSSRRKRA
jgi:hypothetical protein